MGKVIMSEKKEKSEWGYSVRSDSKYSRITIATLRIDCLESCARKTIAIRYLGRKEDIL